MTTRQRLAWAALGAQLVFVVSGVALLARQVIRNEAMINRDVVAQTEGSDR